MSRGIPLTEEDRAPWLLAIAEKIVSQENHPFVLACSALRERYRQQLRTACPELRIIHLHGTRELLLERLQQRENHFMPASLLDSQLATLEAPSDALTIDISLPVDSIVQHIFSSFSSTSHV
jgi:gluconokinase